MAQPLRFPPFMWEIKTDFLAPGFNLAQSHLLRNLGNKPMKERYHSLCFFLFLCVTVPFKKKKKKEAFKLNHIIPDNKYSLHF